MQVTSLLLLAATTAIATVQSQGIAVYVISLHSESCNAECFNGQLREGMTTVFEYCYNGEWIEICSPTNQSVTDEIMAACTLLGYRDSGGKLAIVVDE